MIKKLLFLAALLIPGVAYGGNPAADLTVQIVPSGSVGNCGTPLGAAAADVQAAGFTTCARYNDFTTPIPNAVGTGLPNNWLNCNQNDTPAVWYWSISYVDAYGNALPCVSGSGANSSNSAVFQTTDPVYGGTVLDLRAAPNPNCNPNLPYNSHCYVVLNSVSYNTDRQTAPNPGLYPKSYFEYVFRIGSKGVNGIGGSIWAETPNDEATRTTGSAANYVELDAFECYGACDHVDSALNMWGGGTFREYYNVPFSTNDPTVYHTLGILYTGDGVGHLNACTYVDGVKQACSGTTNYTHVGEDNERIPIFMSTQTDNVNTANLYIKSVKVWTCANWQDPSSNGECASP